MQNILTNEVMLEQLKEIFNYLDLNILNKIPEKIRKPIQNFKSNNYKFTIDKTKTLAEQNLLKETEQFISWLYLEYCCEANKKQELLKKCKENEIQYKTIDEMFQKKENKDIIIVKKQESWYLKLWNKIKKFLNYK